MTYLVNHLIHPHPINELLLCDAIEKTNKDYNRMIALCQEGPKPEFMARAIKIQKASPLFT